MVVVVRVVNRGLPTAVLLGPVAAAAAVEVVLPLVIKVILVIVALLLLCCHIPSHFPASLAHSFVGGLVGLDRMELGV